MLHQPRTWMLTLLLTACAALTHADAQDKKDAPEVSAADLVSALNWNDALADEVVGTRIRVKGYAKQVERKDQGYTVILGEEQSGTEKESLALHFRFGVDDRKALSELPHRRLVTVEGYCHGKLSPAIVRFTESKIISVEPVRETTTKKK